MGLDIHSGIKTAFFLLLIGVVFLFIMGARSIRKGNALYYHQKRMQFISRGWWMFGLAILFGALAALLNQFGEPYIYRYFPPTPTVTLTPTITITPTITLTPTITQIPTITETPSITPFPTIPSEISKEFSSRVTPNPKAVLSVLSFSTKINEDLLPIDPKDSFTGPVTHIYGAFTYDKLDPGVQWTAIWYHDDLIFFFETIPWNGATGGYGYTDCEKPVDLWTAGTYEVQIFIGMEWMVSGSFIIEGDLSP